MGLTLSEAVYEAVSLDVPAMEVLVASMAVELPRPPLLLPPTHTGVVAEVDLQSGSAPATGADLCS